MNESFKPSISQINNEKHTNNQYLSYYKITTILPKNHNIINYEIRIKISIYKTKSNTY